MATYQFSPNGALDTADELTFVTKKLEESLSALVQKVNQFIAANEGTAPENYTIAQQLWNQGQQKMEQSLAVGRQKLDQIRVEYVLGDARGANVFGSLI